MRVVKIILVFLVVIVAAVFLTLQRNQANLFQAPGFDQRLQVFATQHWAETADDHVFEELRPPVYNVSAEKLYNRVLYVASELGWGITSNDSDKQNANFVARTPIFMFEDDVFVQVKAIDKGHSTLYVHASSRKGLADLASNSGHIQKLIKNIHQ